MFNIYRQIRITLYHNFWVSGTVLQVGTQITSFDVIERYDSIDRKRYQMVYFSRADRIIADITFSTTIIGYDGRKQSSRGEGSTNQQSAWVMCGLIHQRRYIFI